MQKHINLSPLTDAGNVRYLESLLRDLYRRADALRLSVGATQTLAAGDAIQAAATVVRVAGSGGAVTLASTPTIADAAEDGTVLILLGTSDANTVTLQRETALPSSNLTLGAATRALGNSDALALLFDLTRGLWVELFFVNNA